MLPGNMSMPLGPGCPLRRILSAKADKASIGFLISYVPLRIALAGAQAATEEMGVVGNLPYPRSQV